MGLKDYVRASCLLILYLILGYIFIMSGLVVCAIMLLASITVWPFNRALYRKIVLRLAYSHWCQFTFLGQWWSGSNCVVFMEDINDLKYVGKEHCIVTMNHKYDIDWMMAWILSERLGMLGGTKIYGKSSLKFVPLLGWAWVFTESIFLKRNWEKDKEIISRDLRKIAEYPPNHFVTLLLFCEGTRFTEEKHQLSLEIAKKKGLPLLKHHLLPRTKGFTLSMAGIKGTVPAILDLTVGFREDGAPPTLMSIVKGQACKAEMYVRRIPLENIPDSEEECAAWLYQHFKEKDDIYDHFVKNGCFKMGVRHEVYKRWNDFLAWLAWAVVLCVPMFYYLGKLFTHGSLYMQLGLVVLIGAVTIGVRLMIAVSETHKGSSYGKTTKTENGKID